MADAGSSHMMSQVRNSSRWRGNRGVASALIGQIGFGNYRGNAIINCKFQVQSRAADPTKPTKLPTRYERPTEKAVEATQAAAKPFLWCAMGRGCHGCPGLGNAIVYVSAPSLPTIGCYGTISSQPNNWNSHLSFHTPSLPLT
ncbi:hypothetical protein M434DRAFT_29795 [Hypoxylon sp. CO27-5]|nr:hypothetical protein M434DRAFT_29795 [Hypoxylon sp. CO27-5]